MKRLKDIFMALALSACTAIPAMLVSCSDDPGVENYYTSTKEYAADFLKNRRNSVTLSRFWNVLLERRTISV